MNMQVGLSFMALVRLAVFGGNDAGKFASRSFYKAQQSGIPLELGLAIADFWL